jgi:hypothetical protein
MEKINCTARVKCKEVWHSVKEEMTSYIKTKEGQLDWSHLA